MTCRSIRRASACGPARPPRIRTPGPRRFPTAHRTATAPSLPARFHNKSRTKSAALAQPKHSHARAIHPAARGRRADDKTPRREGRPEAPAPRQRRRTRGRPCPRRHRLTGARGGRRRIARQAAPPGGSIPVSDSRHPGDGHHPSDCPPCARGSRLPAYPTRLSTFRSRPSPPPAATRRLSQAAARRLSLTSRQSRPSARPARPISHPHQGRRREPIGSTGATGASGLGIASASALGRFFTTGVGMVPLKTAAMSA